MPHRTISCLVVEPDAKRAAQIAGHLRAYGVGRYLCFMAANLREAKRALVRENIGLVISKGVLPEADHLDILARYRSVEEEPVVLCLLEDEEQSVILDASKDGAEDYLFYSDLSAETLQEAIRHANERRDLLKELRFAQTTAGEGRAVYRGLLHCLDVALFLVSRPEGTLFFSNKVAEAWYGESKASVLLDLIEYGVLEADSLETEIGLDDVAMPHLELRSVKVEWKGRDCSLITLRNISKRKRAEQAYRTSQRRLDLAIKASNIGMWSWDLVENRFYFSERWKKLIGYEGSAFPDTLKAFKEHLHTADLPEVEEVFSQAQRGEVSEIELKYRMRHRDGGYRWFLCRAECFPDDSGKLSTLIGSHIDITRTETGSEAAVFEASLSSKLGVRMERIAADLEVGARQLRQSFRGDSEIVRRIVELERLSSSFACLNEVLQSDAAKKDLSPTPLNLGQEVEELHRSQVGLLGDGAEVAVEVKEDILLHGFSRRSLLFALTEAFVCVRDAVTTDFKSRIQVSVFRDKEHGGLGCVRYRYVGKPISNAELLALAKTKYLKVTSEGAVATAELRVHFGLEAADPGSAEGLPLALLAEDDSVLRLAIHTMLESIGYAVRVTKDGEEAIEAYSRRKSEFSVALVDMQMPHVDGFGVVAAIRAIDAELPIILMSGDSTDEVSSRIVVDDSRCAFLAKPFGITDLKLTIGELAKSLPV